MFSPGGKKIASSSNEIGSDAIHVLDLTSGTSTVVTDTSEDEY